MSHRGIVWHFALGYTELGEIGTPAAITALDVIRSQASEESVQKAVELALSVARAKPNPPYDLI